MIDLYTWMTDNGYKARHMLEESGLEYTLKPVNIQKKEQFDPEHLKISPAHKIPALIDSDGPGGQAISLFESGAILKYTASKADNGLYPTEEIKRLEVDQWLFYGSATFTTLAQQYGFFMIRNPEDVPEGKKHYDMILKDHFSIVDKRLSEVEYVAGDYSIADIAIYADAHIYGDDKWIGMSDYPNLKRWHDAIEARPAVQTAWTPFA